MFINGLKNIKNDIIKIIKIMAKKEMQVIKNSKCVEEPCNCSCEKDCGQSEDYSREQLIEANNKLNSQLDMAYGHLKELSERYKQATDQLSLVRLEFLFKIVNVDYGFYAEDVERARKEIVSSMFGESDSELTEGDQA